jgi:hypothetical protein
VRTLVVDPEAITLRPDFATGCPVEAAVRILNASDAAVQLGPVTCPDRVALALDRTKLRPGESATARLQVEADFVRRESLRVTVGTSHPREKTLAVSVAVRPTPEVNVGPAAVALGAVTRDGLRAACPKRILLWGPGLGEFAIARVACPPYLRAEFQPVQPGRPCEVLLQVGEEFEPKTLVGEALGIHIEHQRTGRKAVIKVPLSGNLLEGG